MRSAFRLRNGRGTVKALLLCLILCHFQAALYVAVAIRTRLVPQILHLAMNFAKEVLVGLVLHNQQFTPNLAVTRQRRAVAGLKVVCDRT